MKNYNFIKPIVLAIIILLSIYGCVSSQNLYKGKNIMKNTNNEKITLRVPNTYLKIINETDESITYLLQASSETAYGDADFSIRFKTLQIYENYETEIGKTASFYYQKENDRYKIITETWSINYWNTESILVSGNDDNSPSMLTSLKPLSIDYSPSYSNDENQIPMQVYRYLIKQQKQIIGKWQFLSPERSVVLDLKEDGNIAYYVAVNDNEKNKLENWLRGKYNYRLDLPDSYALTVTYTQAEYSPYNFENGIPTSYVAENVALKSTITIEIIDTNTIKVSVDCDNKGFASNCQIESLQMKKLEN